MRETQKQIFNFLTCHHTWNRFMQNKWAKANINLTNVSISHVSMFVGPSGYKREKQKEKEARAPWAGQKIKTKATMTNLQNFQPSEEESKEEEEEIATGLGGGGPLTDHFTTTNLSSEEEED